MDSQTHLIVLDCVCVDDGELTDSVEMLEDLMRSMEVLGVVAVEVDIVTRLLMKN